MRTVRRVRDRRTAETGLSGPGTCAAEWLRRGGSKMVGSHWARGAVLLTLLLAISAPARADRDLVGVTKAKFSWSPATGGASAYRIYVETNGGGFLPHPVTPIKYEGDRVVVATGSYGAVIRVQVAALVSLAEPEGPRSDPSERIRFVAPPLPPASNPPPTSTPPPATNPPPPPPPSPGSEPPAGQPSAETLPDFDGDGHADLLLREGSSGTVMLWTMGAGGPKGAVRVGSVPASSAIAGNGDYDGDGHADLLSRDDATGALTLQLLVKGAVVGGGPLPAPASPIWEVVGSGDFDADGRDDVLLRNASEGRLEIWFMNGPEIRKRAPLQDPFSAAGWQVAGVADFNGDRLADILWFHPGKNRVKVSLIDSRAAIRKNWRLFKSDPGADIVAIGDADGNGLPDVVVRSRATGMLQIRFTGLAKGKPRAHTTRILDHAAFPAGGDGSLAGYEVQSVGDYDGDKKIDLVLRNTTSDDLRVWYLDQATVVDEILLTDPGAGWVFEGVGAESPATHR